ncbi:MAG: alanine--tRNA ligase [Thermodesulfovibrionales bacterium]|nr:alanine--tRNA ligase [Thermodesulfovibrionales bacterium]
MKSNEIREGFLDYFRRNGHEVVKSSPLIPHNDPTLLFTNAGMVQFKSVFLGDERRNYTRATTCQKSMRAGGKHNDLENVGHTARHHTFFEMLGNFSFGDYFKADAINFAWDLLVGQFGLLKERLWVSVYENDDEAERLWCSLTDINPNHIVRLGEKDNFWQMGDTGPCGPCSEIIIDQGEGVGCKTADCKVGCDCDRYLELWNLVFMQFNRDKDGMLTPLPKPSIDTGMGLERISAVLQGKSTNYDTDLFMPIIAFVESLSGKKYRVSEDDDISFRVISDHIRAITFLISDGLIPSNEGRGYVLRRIIRRASRHARLLGLTGASLYRVVEPVVETFGDIYPELKTELHRTIKLLKIEEERFTKTVEQGISLLDEIISKLKSEGCAVIPGEEVFKLYDTYGFPLDLARDMALDKHMTVDEEGFQKAMQEQRQRARASWTGGDTTLPPIYRQISEKHPETHFVGYDTLEDTAKILAIIKDGKEIQHCSKGDEVELFLDKTPFYGESGGQVGDKGEISVVGKEGIGEVLKTTKILSLICHHLKVLDGGFSVGDEVLCKPDKERRISTARNHTSTHLLHKALREVIGEHVKQSGSLVSPERLRFDFTHFYALEDSEIKAIEDIVNEKIIENIPVRTEVKDLDTALKEGVTALFDEKYGEKVRIVRVGDFSAELCGGTHCKATGDIGVFTITSEGSVASGIRRIEALTGRYAYEHLKSKANELQAIGELLKTDKPLERLQRLLNELKEKEKAIHDMKLRSAVSISDDILTNARVIDGVKVVVHKIKGLEQKDMRSLSDSIRDKLQSGIIVIASVNEQQAGLLCVVTKDLTDRFKANAILSEIARLSDGKAGGKPDMAQGGTKSLDKLDNALQETYNIIENLSKR